MKENYRKNVFGCIKPFFCSKTTWESLILLGIQIGACLLLLHLSDILVFWKFTVRKVMKPAHILLDDRFKMSLSGWKKYLIKFIEQLTNSG